MKKVCIIGGGFSGVSTAMQLLKKNNKISITVINDNCIPPLGIAYSTSRKEHLLNVPAGKMSVFPDQPMHFSEWLKDNSLFQSNNEFSFVPRLLYGKYLKDAFSPFLTDNRLTLKNGKAISMEKRQHGYSVKLENGDIVEADFIILAMGNYFPAAPKLKNNDLFKHRHYFNNPWDDSYLNDLDTNDPMLLIGTGLTMIDCMLSLYSQGHKGKIIAVSPRGYIPMPHVLTDLHYPDFYPEIKNKTLLETFKVVRKHLSLAEKKQIPWQSVIDRIRPHAKDIWQNFSLEDKQRFVSHVRHIWGLARHRLPVEVHKKMLALMHSGQLEILGGRLENIIIKDDNFLATMNLRKQTKQKNILVSRIINCTGPQLNYKELNDPLIVSLFEQNIISSNKLKMGIRALPDGSVIDNQAKVVPGVFAVGSMLRGDLWETTAVPELRVHAEIVASRIIGSID